MSANSQRTYELNKMIGLFLKFDEMLLKGNQFLKTNGRAGD